LIKHFSDRLISAIQSKRTPLVVGLDPRLEQLPQCFRQRAGRGDLKAAAQSTAEFCCAVVDCVAPLVPAVKPQMAFFELLGPDGLVALARVIDHAKGSGLLVILDGKRGDIGSTAEAYAQAYLGEDQFRAWNCDALTVNPFLGDDSLEPFINAASANGTGAFVLVKTSNPGSATFQEQRVGDRPLYELVASKIQLLAHQTVGKNDYGCVGAVVGATSPRQLAELRAFMPNTMFLIPGFGAQGATARDVAAGFDSVGLGAVVNSSRAIIYAWERAQFERLGASHWQRAVEEATREAISQLAGETSAGRLR
jgi:orotidine-5'-phosphate decarboxylase